MNFAIVENGTIVRYPINLRQEFPTTLFPAVISPTCLPENVVVVETTERPVPGAFQTAEEQPPEFSGGSWRQRWELVDLHPDLAIEAVAALRNLLCEQANQDRDARIDGGFTFQGYTFQSKASDRENIAGAAQAAFMAKAAGAQPGDLRWANPDADFVWITANNTLVPMDVDTVIGLFQTGVAFKSAMTFYARGLKDAILAAEDPQAVYDAAVWPE